MATLKYKENSPYTKPSPSPPCEDYIYARFIKDLEMKAENKEDPVIGIAIIGLGRAGIIHLSNIISNPRVKLLYIMDNDQIKCYQMKKYWRLDNVSVINCGQDGLIYSDPKVDAVIVCSPTFTHEALVLKSLKAGKAVFCEKPIAEEPGEVARCFEVAARHVKPLFCAFNRRFDPSYASVRRRVRAGEVGHVHTIKVTSRDSPLPSLEYLRVSGGIFKDCMVHDIDLITWILGEYPVKISVLASTHIPEIGEFQDYDTVTAVLRFASGTLGMIDLSRNSPYGYDQRLEVFGPRGSIAAGNERPLQGVSAQPGLAGVLGSPIYYSFASRFQAAYASEMEHFVDVVLGKAELAVQVKEILAVSKVTEACETAARAERVVELEWSADELPSAE